VARVYWFILSFLFACGVARGAGAAPILDTFSLVDGEFTVRQMASRSRMLNTVGDARALIRGDIARAGPTVRGEYQLINFFDPENTGGGGHFAGGFAFPGDGSGDDQAFAVRVRGWIDIPQPGVYTFGVGSDDGFRMRLGRLFMRHRMPRTTADTLGSAFFGKARRYRLKLTYFEQGDGAELELFAARGLFDTFVDGTLPTGIALPPDDGGGGGGDDNGPPNTPVPEPASAGVVGLIALWTLAASRPARSARRRHSRRPASHC
jgi:hypothetical protein